VGWYAGGFWAKCGVRWSGEVQKQISLLGDLTSILVDPAKMLVIMRGVVEARVTLSPIL